MLKRYPDLPVFDADFPLLGIIQHFDEPIGSRGLEFGANDNYLSAILQRNGYDMTAIDPRPWEPEDALINEGGNRNVFWKQIQSTVAEARPHLSPPYDFIVSASAIEHFGLAYYPGDPSNLDADSEAMDLAYEWLKEGGRAYITVPVGQSKTTYHWRRYNAQEINDRIIRNFTVEAVHVLWSWDATYRSLDEAYQWAGEGCNYEPLFILKKETGVSVNPVNQQPLKL